MLPPCVDVIIPSLKRLDDLVELASQIYSTAGLPCRVVPICKQQSSPKNRNEGLDIATSEIVAMVDDDMSFPPEVQPDGWLRVLVEALMRPKVIIAQAQLFCPSGKTTGRSSTPGGLAGGYALMMGLDGYYPAKSSGETIIERKQVITSCFAFRPKGIRFDEGLLGSGWEDNDLCKQLELRDPDGIFVVCHDAHVVHANEMKNQKENFILNRMYYEKKWGLR